MIVAASSLARATYFNDARPHQGIGQKIPSGPAEPPAVGGRSREPPSLVASTTTTGGPPSSDGSGSQFGAGGNPFAAHFRARRRLC